MSDFSVDIDIFRNNLNLYASVVRCATICGSPDPIFYGVQTLTVGQPLSRFPFTGSQSPIPRDKLQISQARDLGRYIRSSESDT